MFVQKWPLKKCCWAAIWEQDCQDESWGGQEQERRKLEEEKTWHLCCYHCEDLLGKLEHLGQEPEFQINYANTSPLRWKQACRLYLATPPAGAVISSRQVVQLPLAFAILLSPDPYRTRAAKSRLLLGIRTSLPGTLWGSAFAQFLLVRASLNTQPFAEVWKLTNSGMWVSKCPHIDIHVQGFQCWIPSTQ